MPTGRLAVVALAVTLCGRAIAEEALPQPTKVCDKAAPTQSACEQPQRVCVPPQRIKVIVPPPEVVFQCSGKRSGGLFNKHCTHTTTCAPAAPCVQQPTSGGQLAFSMNYAMPFMSYQMSPMMMGMGGFGGYGFPSMMGGGMGFGGGIPFGMGGFPALGAGGLGLGGAGALTGSTSTGLEAQLLQALLSRSSGSAATGDTSVEARIRRLDTALNARIEEEMAKMRQEVSQGLVQVLGSMSKMTDRLTELDARLKKLEAKP